VRARDVWQRVRWVLALVLLCALATCPAAQRRCSNRRDAREAPALLRYLVREIRAQFARDGRLPAIDVGPTPAIGACCVKGTACGPDPSLWAQPGWRALRFSIDDRHRFSYQVRRDGDAVVLTAVGDQDCDTVRAVYEVRLSIDGERVIEAWSQRDPLE
jgi:hypothetical protein